MMRVMHIKLMPWRWAGAVLVGGSPADFKAYAKKYIDADIENGPNSVGHAYVEYGKPFLLWIESLKDVSCLAHEAFHVTAGVLEGRGVKFNAGSEEAYTYTMQDIIDQVLRNRKWRKA